MRKVSIAVSVARQSLLIVTDPTPKNQNHASKIRMLGITLSKKHLRKTVKKSALSSTTLQSKLVFLSYCYCYLCFFSPFRGSCEIGK